MSHATVWPVGSGAVFSVLTSVKERLLINNHAELLLFYFNLCHNCSASSPVFSSTFIGLTLLLDHCVLVLKGLLKVHGRSTS